MMLMKDNQLYGWGSNYFGLLSSSPQKISFPHYLKKIHCGNYCMAVVTNTDEIYTWDGNTDGELCLGDNNNRISPTKLVPE